MKKLISAQTIEAHAQKGFLRLEVDLQTTIVTPQAKNAAHVLGVELVEKKTNIVSYKDKQKIIAEVQAHFSGGKYSRSKIMKAVQEVLAQQ